jgi:transposase
LFYTIALENLVPSDHPVRLIAEVLDLSFLYEATRDYYSHEGKPSVDPVVLFKLHILGYFFGVSSERKLFQELRVNLAYRWYLGYDLDEPIPDHSILSKARQRFPQKLFGTLFMRIIALCREAGLISGDYHFIDSTLVRADASKDSFRTKLLTEAEYLAQLDAAAPVARGERSYAFDGVVDPKKMGRRREKPRKSESLCSTTDPDAQLATRPGKGTFPAYKAHLCVDRKRRVILSITGSVSSEDDMSRIDPLLSAACLSAGARPRVVVADKHYGGIEALKYYQDKGIRTCIHPRIAENMRGRLKNSDFRLSGDKRSCTCPAGIVATKRIQNSFRFQFRFPAAACQGCSERTRCTNTSGGRLVSYYSGTYFSEALALAESRQGQRLFRARQILAEGVLGEAKTLHGLSRCRYRGLLLFEVQLLLTASVINLKRLLKTLRNKGKTALREAFAELLHQLSGALFTRLATAPLLDTIQIWLLEISTMLESVRLIAGNIMDGDSHLGISIPLSHPKGQHGRIPSL